MIEGSFYKNDVPAKIIGLKFLNDDKLTALIQWKEREAT